MGFERVAYLRVQSLPRAAQQAAVRRVLHQRVLKAIDCIRRRAPLEDQPGSGEAGECGFQLAVGKAGDGAQQRVGKFASDRCANLRHQPHRCQVVEPCHQRVVQRRRDREGRQCAVEHVAARLFAQQTALQDALGQFLDEQRHAVGPIGDLVGDLLG